MTSGTGLLPEKISISLRNNHQSRRPTDVTDRSGTRGRVSDRYHRERRADKPFDKRALNVNRHNGGPWTMDPSWWAKTGRGLLTTDVTNSDSDISGSMAGSDLRGRATGLI
ncbi:hypothetical protein EVAR_19905_1 [Eumeta japonica]|uniref:Uncharacterized protein n=1 Tax=Eumeta variegata TaxID=151549 RepID=A0A4C1XN19_EUMVA|nr:hypothetical protein EVAR_19905_1 [Eumeta japonica]